jgi:hypothetical protein
MNGPAPDSPTDRPRGRHRNFTEQVFGHIAARISDGQLPLGHRLPTSSNWRGSAQDVFLIER